MIANLKALAAALLVFAGLGGAAQADQVDLISFHSYKLENRPKVVFPGKRVHVSPYPMSKRAASVWTSDFCWRACTGQSGMAFPGSAARQRLGGLPGVARRQQPVLPAHLPDARRSDGQPGRLTG